MTTPHQLAAMTDEQFEHHQLRQAVQDQITRMRDEAERMDHANQNAAGMVLRRHADMLHASLHVSGPATDHKMNTS